MAIIGQGISLRGMAHDEFHYPFNLAAGTTRDDVNKPVALDPSAPNTVKVAGDGDTIIGRLVTVENREIEGILVGAVELHGGWRFEKADAEDIAVGDTVVGAGGGLVKALLNDAGDTKAPNHSVNMVVEVDGNFITIVR